MIARAGSAVVEFRITKLHARAKARPCEVRLESITGWQNIARIAIPVALFSTTPCSKRDDRGLQKETLEVRGSHAASGTGTASGGIAT